MYSCIIRNTVIQSQILFLMLFQQWLKSIFSSNFHERYIQKKLIIIQSFSEKFSWKAPYSLSGRARYVFLWDQSLTKVWSIAYTAQCWNKYLTSAVMNLVQRVSEVLNQPAKHTCFSFLIFFFHFKIPPCFIQQQYLWNIAIQPVVGCSHI